MTGASRGLRYLRDVGEVLFLNRVVSSPTQREIAGEAATIVRRARFHAHARIPNIPLSQLLSQLGVQPVLEVRLPGSWDLCGVGNATYYHTLAVLTQALQPSAILEFGTYLGVGTLTLALNSPSQCRIVTLDLPDVASVRDDVHGLSKGDLELIDRRCTRVGEALLGSSVEKKVEQIRADSLTWEPDVYIGTMDLVLIDGGHSGPVVRADTENAFKLISSDGTIVWDDYFYLYPDLVAFLDSLVDEGLKLFAISGTNLVIYDPRLQ